MTDPTRTRRVQLLYKSALVLQGLVLHDTVQDALEPSWWEKTKRFFSDDEAEDKTAKKSDKRPGANEGSD